MNTEKFEPNRDSVEHYIGNKSATSMQNYAAIKLGILTDMHIKLSYDEKEHLFSLNSEIAIDNFVRKIIADRL